MDQLDPLILVLLLIVVAALMFPGGPGTPRRFPVPLPFKAE